MFVHVSITVWCIAAVLASGPFTKQSLFIQTIVTHLVASRWALCAEGFMLDMPLLTTVGALIGCSGAALTKIMCDAMNRDIVSVILGGYGTKSSAGGEAMKFEGEATTTDVDSVVNLLSECESVIIVPGYGLA